MLFFDRGSKDKPTDPLERLRQYTNPPAAPPAAPAPAPAVNPAASPPAAANPASDRRAELDAVMEEAVGTGSSEDTLTGNEYPVLRTPPASAPSRPADVVGAAMAPPVEMAPPPPVMPK